MSGELVRDIRESFQPFLDEGTMSIFRWNEEIWADGGNWALVFHPSGTVTSNLPMNDPLYYAEDPDEFLDNVLGLEVMECMILLNEKLEGRLAWGLARSRESWSIRLATRILLGQKSAEDAR